MNERKYRVVKGGWPWGCDDLHIGFEFTVSKVDEKGQLWSEDVSFMGHMSSDGEGWCVCRGEAVTEGYVVEVSQ